MNNATIQAVQNAANSHVETAERGLIWAVTEAAKTPFKAAKEWFLTNGYRDILSADIEAKRVSEFNAKLESCNACIAPEDFADGDTEEQLTGAIQHFEALAAECLQYASDLKRIQMRRF